VLIMNGVSIVGSDLFDKLKQIARTIRNNGRRLSGMQLVITGDFTGGYAYWALYTLKECSS